MRVSRLWLVVRILCTLVVLGVVLSRADLGALVAAARAAPWWAFAAPAGLLLFNSGVHAVRLRLLLGGGLPLRRALQAVLYGNFSGLVLPTGGGEAVKGLVLARHAGGAAPAFAALFTSRLLELGPWGGLLVWGGLVVLPPRLPAWAGPTLLAAAAMLTGYALTLAVLASPTRALAWIPAWAGRARLQRVASLRASAGQIAGAGALAAGFALVNCTAVLVVLRGYGVAITLPEVMGLIPAADVIISLPVTIAGVGVREGMFVHGLAPWGVPAELAVAAATTRWSGEVFRAAVGGAWWLLAGQEETRPSPDRGEGEDTFRPEST